MKNISKPHIIQFDKIGTSEIGFITPVEACNQVPFEVERVYWTYDTPSEVQRGNHAHKTLQQVIVAVNGHITITLEGPDGKSWLFKLTNPSMGLYIPELHWRKIDFSEGAILLCMASMKYDAGDYIRDYDQFKDLMT